jgi:hypothetical protein
MAETEMDFHASVAQDYELRRRPERDSPSVQSVGKSRLMRPTRNAMNYAVELLLRTPLPELLIDRRVEKLGGIPMRTGRRKYPEADQIAALEQNALAIARRIGLLEWELNPRAPAASERESMWGWFDLARDIQQMFSGRFVGGQSPIQIDEWPVGTLTIYISLKSGRPSSMTVRPGCTRDALRYHAAQMVTSGTRSQPCKWCKGPLLIGGPRARGKKKEGARFCSERCRWHYNNDRRKKN